MKAKMYGKTYKICRRCSTQTFTYDAELREWYCDQCEEWADV